MARTKINNVSDLEKSVESSAGNAKAKRKARYRLARELGFRSVEACYLQNRSEVIIRRLAEERKLQKHHKDVLDVQ